MLQNNKNSSTLLILLGLLLIGGSIAGALFYTPQISEESENSRYRFFEKSQPIEIIKLDPTEVTSDKQIETRVVYPHGLLSIGHTYIHYPLHPEYEQPKIPDKIEIPAIGLTAPIMISDYNKTKVEGETFGQWVAPSKFTAGWHPDSALLGQTGNVVINGHHNEFGKVFGELVDLEIGDLIIVYFEDEAFTYVVSNRLILPERFQETEVRLQNARWLGKTDDTRLTLVTCWPAESNTHRLIIVARPY